MKISNSKRDRLPPLERLRKTLKPREVEAALRKEESVSFRLTAADKAEMVEMAKRCRCTLTEYLVSLHRIAVAKLETLL